MAGTWSYRSYYMYQAGCWPEGGGTVCLLDSTLEAFTGTVVISPPRDSLFGTTPRPYRTWKVPFHMEIHVQQWDYDGACNGLPLSCFTNRAPTADFVETHDSLFEIGQEANQPAQLMLRSGRGQWLWLTSDVSPVRLYDSIGAAPPPAHPGVRDLQKLP